MRKISLQWRITLMTVLLIAVVCVAMKLLLCDSGVRYMDNIGSFAMEQGGEPASFDPQQADSELTIVVHEAQERFCMTNWYVAAAVTLLSGVLAYFVTGRALRPLRRFATQVERVRLDNLADVRVDGEELPEFRQLSQSFNLMLERLNRAFEAQRQFAGNAAHELRTPLALMQAQLELFSAEHPDVRPETAEFLALLREQTERLTLLSKALLEMNDLQSVPRTDNIQMGPMIEELFTDMEPLAERRGITLEHDGGDISITGSDMLIYRMLFNLTENAIKYNRPGGRVSVSVTQREREVEILIEDTGYGIPEEYRRSVFQPFFRVDRSRSREFGGVGLGLSLVWEIADLHGGSVRVRESSESGTVIAVALPSQSYFPESRIQYSCASASKRGKGDG